MLVRTTLVSIPLLLASTMPCTAADVPPILVETVHQQGQGDQTQEQDTAVSHGSLSSGHWLNSGRPL